MLSKFKISALWATKARLAATAFALLGAGAFTAGAITAQSAYSSFNATTSPPTAQSLATGTLAMTLGASGTATGDALTVGASNLVPGDTVQRAVAITNGGSIGISTISMAVTDTSPTALVTNTTNGLQALVQSCSLPWTSTALTDGGWSYTCSGTTASEMASTPAGTLVADTTAPPLATPTNATPLAPSSVTNLMVTLTLPTTAPNSMQGLADSLTFTFTGVQIAGTAE